MGRRSRARVLAGRGHATAQGRSSIWQSTGFQNRWLGVRVPPPLIRWMFSDGRLPSCFVVGLRSSARDSRLVRGSSDDDCDCLGRGANSSWVLVTGVDVMSDTPKAGSSSFFRVYKKGQGYYTRMGTAVGAGILLVGLCDFVWET